MVGRGLPRGWGRIARAVESQFGRRLELRPAPDFGSEGAGIAVYLDGELVGETEFLWAEDESEQEVLAWLVQDQLQGMLVQDLGDEIGFDAWRPPDDGLRVTDQRP